MLVEAHRNQSDKKLLCVIGWLLRTKHKPMPVEAYVTHIVLVSKAEQRVTFYRAWGG